VKLWVMHLTLYYEARLVTWQGSVPTRSSFIEKELKRMTTTMWIWLAVGCIPYAVNRTWSASGTLTLTITAIFWRVQVERHPDGRFNWALRVPLISRMQAAVWAAVNHLRNEPGLEEEEDEAT
jgi:hypothetical protein